MKPNHLLWGFLAVSQSTIIHAATFTWDQNGAAAPVLFDNGGVWTNANLFYDGAVNLTWPVGTGVTDTAAFGSGVTAPYSGIPGGVTFTTAISAGGLTFNPYIGNNVKFNIAGGAGGSLTLNGTPVIAVETRPSRPFAAINAILAGTAGFDVSTTTGGILEIGTQANTITGGIRLQTGSSLSIGNDTGYGGTGNGLTFAGTSTLITRANTTPAITRTFTIGGGNTAKFDSLNAVTLTVPSAIVESAGSGSLQKEGLGGLTLGTGSSYTGSTGIRQGTLTLNFANVTAPVAPNTDIINAASALRLFGGTLAVTGKASTANSQTFSSLTLLPGTSGLTSTAGATGGTTAVALGAVTRNPGSTLNVATLAAGTSYTTATADTNGILGGFATVNNADWLSAPGGVFTPFAAYQTGTDATAWLATDNVSLAATPVTPLAASATLNSVKFTATADLAIPAPETLTLASGGVLVTGTGTNSISGGTLRGSASGDLVVHQHNTTTPFTVSAVIADNTGAGALTKSGGGTLVLSGTNLHTGNTFLNAGTLEISADANLGAGTTVTSRAGTTLRIAGGSAFTSAKNFRFDLGSDSFGGAGLGAGPNSAGNFNVAVTNTAGATISGAFNVNAGTLVKSGAGTLTLTNGGFNQLGRLNGGLCLTVNNGGLLFDGGAASEYSVSQGEFTIGDNTTTPAVVTVNSGTVTAGSWISVGRGNGTTGLQSGLNVNGGTLNAGNLFTGFANGVAGYNAAPFINISNAAVVNVSDTLRLSESPGCSTTMTVSGTSVLRLNNSAQIGFGGRAVMTIADNATVGTGQLWMGGNNAAANTGSGVILQTGGSFSVQGFLGTGTSGDWRIGGFQANDVNAYGAYVISGGTFNTGNRNVQVGASGIGILDVRGGIVDMNNGGGFPVIGRFAGGFGLLDVSSGTFNQNGTGQLLIIGEAGTGSLNVSGTGSVVAAGNPGGAGNGGGTGGLRTGHTPTGSSFVSLNGGTLETSGIAKSSNAVTATSYVYLNGGNLKARASNTTYLQGHDNAVVGPAGAKIDTNGQSIVINQALLRPDGSSGVTTIPVATGGTGYLGAPIIRITGGAGVGASAIATVSGGAVTGITITNPGTGYAAAPTVTLLGGGATAAATLSPATFGPNAVDGGLTQSGFGTLTLSGTNTYTGTTAVNGDTLLVTGSVAGPVTVAADCTIGGTGTLGSTLTVDAAGTLAPGLSAGTLTAGTTVMPGTYECEIDGATADRLTVNGDLDLTGSTLEVTVLAGGATQASYTIASYTGNLAGGLAVSGSLPATYSLFNDVANKEIKLISAGNYGIWAAGFGLVLSGTGAADADADFDGIPNAIEYVTGGDPTVSSQTERPLLNASGSDLILTFNRKDSSETADVTTAIEVGTTLNLWPDIYTVGATTLTSTAGVTVTPGAPGFDLITLTVPKGTDPRKFARLRVTIAP